MSQDKLYDLSQLISLSGGNSDFVNKMVQMFLEMTPDIVGRINNGYAENNLDEVGAAAHKIKPTIDMMGITLLRDSIRQLESNAKNRTNLDTIPGLIQDVNDVLNRVMLQLQER